MRQLTDVDRMRVITLAQQETVSLAQILKVGCSSSGFPFVGVRLV